MREGANFLQSLLSRETNLDIKIGKISGKLRGLIRFDDVRLENPNLPAGLRVIFRAERLEFNYDLFDFLSKKFHSKIVITVRSPEFYWRPPVGLRGDAFPFFSWMRDLLLTQRQRFVLHVKNLKLITGADRNELKGIHLDYENDHVDVTLPISHYELLGNDISTQIHMKAHLEWGMLQKDDQLAGQLFTEGTVVNWQPLPWESKMDFALTRSKILIDSSFFLGGLDLTGAIDFSPEPEVSLSLKTKDFPIKNFSPFLSRGSISNFDGTLDLEALFEGEVDSLKTEIHATINGGKTGQRHYRALNLHASGVYPTIRIYDSQMLMDDGIAMKFAEKTVEFWDLFSSRTYKKLISDSDQSQVAMGDWEFKREMNDSNLPEFLVGRSLGKHASLQFRKFNEPFDEARIRSSDPEDKQQVEVGVEYKLQSKDSVHYKVREDEQIVGVERKLSF